MQIERLDLTTAFLLKLPQIVVKPFFDLPPARLDRLPFPDRYAPRVKQRLRQHPRNHPRRLPAPPGPVLFQRPDRPVKRRTPPLVDFTHPAKQADPFGKPGLVRVENPNDAEKLPESRSPFIGVITLARAVDQSDPRLTGPAQDLHFRLVIAPVRMRAVNDIQDRAAIEDRTEQFAFLLEFTGSRKVANECLNHLPPA